MATYTGFSTYNRLRKFRLTDFDLVRQDLFNHFSIRRGEKLMNPKLLMMLLKNNNILSY